MCARLAAMAAGLLGLARCAAAVGASPAADLDTTWAFPQSSVVLPTRAWLGGDSDWSIPLGNGSALWLFGDTFVGGWNASTRQRVQAGIAMPHGTLGRVDGPGRPLVPFWNETASGEPVPWFAPQEGPAADYLWTTAGVRAGNGLLLPSVRVRATGGGAFGFEVVATSVVSVPDARPHPRAWSYATCDLPGTGQAQQGGLGTVFHSAVMRVAGGSAARGEGGAALALLGQRRAAGGADDAVMVRLSSQALARCDWGGAEAWAEGAWRPLPSGPAGPDWASLSPLFSPSVSETTITPRPACGGGGFFSCWVPFGSATVRVRTAPAATGPWSDEPSLAFGLPAPANDTASFFSYAAKAHPELDGGGACESVISVVTNAKDVARLMEPGGADAYVPRMWRIRWAA